MVKLIYPGMMQNKTSYLKKIVHNPKWNQKSGHLPSKQGSDCNKCHLLKRWEFDEYFIVTKKDIDHTF